MMPPVDYDFYANVFLGRELEPVRFPRLAARAGEFVEELCRGKCGSVPEQDWDLLRFAVCAVVEVLLNEERMEQRVFSGENNIVSESVGGYSVSYGSRALDSQTADYLERKKKEAAVRFLSAVPALQSLFCVRSFLCLHQMQ